VGLADARESLAGLTTPTLVLHREHDVIPVEEAEVTANAIANARLTIVPGIDHHPWAGDQESLLEPIAAFLEQLRPRDEAGRTRRSGRQRPRSGPGSLTEAEGRVAQLAASGHSNPDIARELHMARTTVETHLKHVYAKLGIEGRHQLSKPDEQARGS